MNEFKYIMQDLYRLYFGVKTTYREILENEEAYYRFKALCRQYMIKQVDKDTTLESHLYHMASDSPEADIYRQIGARVKLSVPTIKKGLLGREQVIFKEEIWKIDDLVAVTPQEKERRMIVLSELQIPKVKLREFVA